MMQDLDQTEQVLSAADIRDELACAGHEASLGFDAIIGLYGPFSGAPLATCPISPLRRFDAPRGPGGDDRHGTARHHTTRQIG